MKKVILALLLLTACGDTPTGVDSPPVTPPPLPPEEPVYVDRTVVIQVLRFANDYLTNALEIYRDKMGFGCTRLVETEFPWPPEIGFWVLTAEVWECTRSELVG